MDAQYLRYTLPEALFERTMRASVCRRYLSMETGLYGDLNLYYFHITTILSLRKHNMDNNAQFVFQNTVRIVEFSRCQ